MKKIKKVTQLLALLLVLVLTVGFLPVPVSAVMENEVYIIFEQEEISSDSKTHDEVNETEVNETEDNDVSDDIDEAENDEEMNEENGADENKERGEENGVDEEKERGEENEADEDKERGEENKPDEEKESDEENDKSKDEIEKEKENEEETEELFEPFLAAFAPLNMGITITLSCQLDDNGFVIAKQPITLEPGLAAQYGYQDAFGGTQVTALDAVVAAHILLFGDNPADINSKLSVNTTSGFIANFMGGGGNFYYMLNGTDTEAPVGDVVLQQGDNIQLFVPQSAFWEDIYAWFEYENNKVDSLVVKAGTDFDLTVMGTWHVIYGAWGAFDDAVDNAGIVLVDLTGIGGTFIKPPLAVADNNGKVTLHFNTTGTYFLSAIDGGNAFNIPLMSPWLELIVTEDGNPLPTLSNITITSPPDKTDYIVGETLDLTGMAVSAVMSNGTANPITDYTVNPIHGTLLDTAGVMVITIAYQDNNASFTVTVTPVPGSSVDYQEAMTHSLGWLRANITYPTVGDEWKILALARAGVNDSVWNDRYLLALDDAITTGHPDLTRWTDYQRVTLALTSLGLDAANYKGNDLTTIFKNLPANNQTFNADIYGLIALDAKPYNGARQLYINAMLAKESNGGWNLAGDPNAPSALDITAMAVQALTPYYHNNASVTAAVDRALTWLETQNANNAEGLAQIIVALSALNIDAAAYVGLLLGYYDNTTGGFERNGTVNPIATEQAAYALVAYHRFVTNANPLFDMRDADSISGGGVVVLPVNKSALHMEIIRADALVAAEYTEASWNAMQAVLLTARNIFVNPDATQTEVDFAKTHLTTVINALVAIKEPDKITASISVNNFPRAGQQNISFNGVFDMRQGDTVYDLLLKTGLTISTSGSAASGIYVSAINGFGEFSDGPLSGWMYSVNGVFPGISPAQYTLRNGDRVAWVFTRDLGEDVGGGLNNTPPVRLPEEEEEEEDETAPEIKTEAIVTNGTAIAEVKHETISEQVAAAAATGADNVTITVSNTDDANRVSVNITVESILEIAENGMTLTIISPIATIVFDPETLLGFAENNNPDAVVTITAALVNAAQYSTSLIAIELTVTVDSNYVSQLNGIATIHVPFTPPADMPATDYDLLTAYHINIDGSTNEMNAAYHPEKSEMVFTTPHFSVFFIAEWMNPFTDVVKEWYYRAVRFVKSEAMMEGTGANTFSPDTDLTRAMMVQILYNLNGKPPVASGFTFNDVPSDAWYADAVAWANANNIVYGYGDGNFGPDDAITREQMALVFYHYSNHATINLPGSTNLSMYSDTNEISSWAADAVRWANGVGLVTGRTDTTLVPLGATTRAEAASLFQRFNKLDLS